MQVVNIVTMEGNRIGSSNGYYTLPSIERMTMACEAKPDVKMPSGAPCGKGIPFIKKYTDSLVAQGSRKAISVAVAKYGCRQTRCGRLLAPTPGCRAA